MPKRRVRRRAPAAAASWETDFPAAAAKGTLKGIRQMLRDEPLSPAERRLARRVQGRTLAERTADFGGVVFVASQANMDHAAAKAVAHARGYLDAVWE
jgi:hypothetical protein